VRTSLVNGFATFADTPPGFAGNDSPSFVFPTAIATKAAAGGSGGSGSGRPAVANKPSFLTGGAGPGGHLSGKRGTEDLDFFIGDEALAASAGPGVWMIHEYLAVWNTDGTRIRHSLSNSARSNRKLGTCFSVHGRVSSY
jgi:hypothetical protein